MRTFHLPKALVKTAVCSAIVWSTLTFGFADQQAHAATPTSIELIASSKEYIGTPYKYGAAPGNTSAFDCSSFTQYIFKGFNVSLPRTSKAQATVGKKVDKGSLSMGDLVFFNTNGKSISHVAIYAGNNKIIHSSNDGVTISSLSSKYWANKYVTARRVLK